jgi:hypothetical protein
MIELVVAVCLVDEPKRCKDVTLNFEGTSVSAGECMTTGQIEMAKWIGEHPNWVIQKWRCGTAGRTADL